MRIVLVTVGKRPPTWIRQGYEEYARRLPAQIALRLRDVAPLARGDNLPAEAARRKEAERVRAAVPQGARVIALDEHGTQWSSADLAAKLERWLGEGRDVAMLIGGADGLHATLVDSADEVWSLSRLTLPHAFVPVLVAEQLYRGWSLMSNHPYHRA